MRIDPKEIYRKVEANRLLLDSCNRHWFTKDVSKEEGHTILHQKWQCFYCNGIVSLSDKLWYERGLKHGGAENDRTTTER